MGDGGLLIKRQEVLLPADKASVPVAIDLPVDLTNRLQRIEIDAQGIGPSAGHVVLLDERARRRPVALVSGGTFEESQWLLSDLYYLERALSPYADVSIGTLEEALARQPALIILADPARIAGEVGQNLARFIAQGGSVLRFAGPNLTADDNSTRREDPLGSASSDADHQNFLPAPLRQGDRALGGAMTWERPGHIAPFDADSPFAGLAIPDDVTINRQVLAEPSNDPSIRIWARLDDGTPLVTAQRRGQGWLAMVHVTATPDWSNLALSGLYVDMLRRVLSLSRISGSGGAADDVSGLLKPTSLLDAFGNLGQPPLSAEALDAQALNSTSPGPRHPPGFYGEDAKRRALNTLPSDARWHAFVPPEKAVRIQAQAGSEIDLAPFLYLAALILLMADLLATLGLAGHLRRRSHAMIMVLAIAGLSALPGPDGFVANAGPINKMSAANESRLAYVRTGDRRVDALSKAGLHGLSEVLARRTAFEPADPNAIDIEQDDLVFYPLLYWPVLPNAAPLSANAVAKVNAYMKGGGLILFDTRDGGSVPGIEQPAQTQLRLLLSSLEVPPLVRISTDHVLSKTFYLMQSFPGRWREGPIWVQATQMRRETADSRASLRPGLRGPVATNDGVSPVIIGAQDWAAAWAVDEHGNPMAAMVPDDPDQREMAYRFGVNVVMYALTGSYKSDQVHVPALLERLGQ